MKRKAVIPLVLGLMIGVFAVKTAVDTFKNAQADQQTTMVQVVRAIQDIAPLEAITREMVELVEVPISLLLPESERIGSLEEVLGRVTGKPIPDRAPVLTSMLAPVGTPSGLVGRIPPGFRAFSVRIDEVTGVAYQIRPGDWVDVLVVMDVPSANGRRETVAEVVLQRVEVAAIGNTTAAMGGAGKSKPRPAKSATLLVAEKDTPKLHLAQTQGRITLVMRGNDARTTDRPASANLASLHSGGTKRETDNAGPAWIEALWGWGSRAGDSGMGREEAEDAPPELPPHAVLVYHGSGTADKQVSIERITFENAQSSRIMSIAFGPPTQGVAGMASLRESSPPKADRRRSESRKSSR